MSKSCSHWTLPVKSPIPETLTQGEPWPAVWEHDDIRCLYEVPCPACEEKAEESGS